MAMDVEGELGFPYWKPIQRRFEPESPFFASGNAERELLAKQIALELTEDQKNEVQSLVGEEGRKIFCPIVGCGACLASLEDFEDHYIARHTASCSVCSRVYPTARLLSIHISETHDSFFQAKVARGYEVYECLVEGCGLKFKSYKGRHQHLVDKHGFPTSFEFSKKSNPSKKRRHKVQRKQATQENKEASSTMEVDTETIDDLVTAVSKLTTSGSSPSSIRFGHHRPRGLKLVPRSINEKKKPDLTSTGTD